MMLHDICSSAQIGPQCSLYIIMQYNNKIHNYISEYCDLHCLYILQMLLINTLYLDMSVVEEDTELRDLVTQTLENNGLLGKIQAQLRAGVFLALEETDKKVARSGRGTVIKNGI